MPGARHRVGLARPSCPGRGCATAPRRGRRQAEECCGAAWSCPCRCGPCSADRLAAAHCEVDAVQDVARRRSRCGGPRASRSGTSLMPGSPCRDRLPAPRGWRGSAPAAPLASTRPFDHHGETVGDREHRVHVVLDQQDRVVSARRREQLDHARAIPRRPCRPAARRAAAPRARWRAPSRSRAGAARRATECRQRGRGACPRPATRERALRGLVETRRWRSAGRKKRERRRMTRLRGEAAVLERGEAGEDVGLLVAAADAQPRDAIGRADP